MVASRFSHADIALAIPMSMQDMDQRQLHTYDIMCQHKKNYEKRIIEGGLVTKSQIPQDLEQKVPVWHLGGHVPSCMDENSLRTTALVGRTYGEIPESNWSVFNGYEYATREMGHGHRIESLTGNFNKSNFGKNCREGTSHIKRNPRVCSHHNKFISGEAGEQVHRGMRGGGTEGQSR